MTGILRRDYSDMHCAPNLCDSVIHDDDNTDNTISVCNYMGFRDPLVERHRLFVRSSGGKRHTSDQLVLLLAANPANVDKG
jgi:hypothetical protein